MSYVASTNTGINALIMAFASFPRERPSLTVLRAITSNAQIQEEPLCLRRRYMKGADWLNMEYAALDTIAQREIEAALTVFRGHVQSGKSYTADVCEAVATALSRETKTKAMIHDLITAYVASVANIWRQHSIKPTRARDSENPDYRSRFHRFAELVLTAAVEPWLRRHDLEEPQQISATQRRFARR